MERISVCADRFFTACTLDPYRNYQAICQTFHYVIFIKTSSSGSLRGPNATIIVTPTTAIFKAGQLHRNVAVLYQSQCEATGTTGVSAIPALTISLTSANCLVSDNATFVVSSAYLIAPNLPAGSAMTATIKTSIDMVPSGRTDPILTTLCDPGKYKSLILVASITHHALQDAFWKPQALTHTTIFAPSVRLDSTPQEMTPCPQNVKTARQESL